jgi:ubiquinone/menaquinone biosynthesis C-methylase UbiE
MTQTTERYTHGHHESVLASHSWRTVDNSAAYLAELFSVGTTVLDVGCGPGTITVDIAERVAPAKVRGVDAAADVIAKAQALASERSLTNLTFAVDDAYALEAADSSVDIVHAHQVLQHLARPVDALREWRRVAGPTGVVAARDVDYSATVWYPLLPGLDRWLELYLAVHRSNGGEPDAGRRLLEWAHQAGFAEVTPSASVWCFSTPDDRAWWGGMWSRRVLESAFAADALGKGLATQTELDQISAAWIEWAAHPDGVLFMTHGEIIARGMR